MLRVFNAMTHQKEEFKTIKPGIVSMYVCGPTVYNYIHLGNARSAIAFDTIRRYLEYIGYQVNYVSNFTDIDDKIIKAAKAAKVSEQVLTAKFEQAFDEDTAPLNIKKATVRPLATEHVTEIIDFVKTLINKGYAYESMGDVYFRARKFPEYGHLAHQSVDDLEIGASERLDDGALSKKEDPIDFAVWKGVANDASISWQSPWGAGRPGWHIECSVMAIKYLGDTIDIHGGGQDLAFPHHTNEIAQSEVYTGKTFANYWLHNGFVTVGDQQEKMSKSLGNFVTVHDLLKDVNPQVLRLMMATTQYRRPISYTETAMQDAENTLKHLTTAYRNLYFRLIDAKTESANTVIVEKIATFIKHFKIAMDDDFNVANAMTVIAEMATYLNVLASQTDRLIKENIEGLLSEYTKMLMVLGIDIEKESNFKQTSDEQVEAKINERASAKISKDYQLADKIRMELQAQGIILEDTPQGTRWHKE
ncbi:cysteine--tRNA ligase [Periweissella beninensis]|uniref:Cysteine--tRNA ligase n=1 Tax=Periweissella beninensis TaxID=504936 RepID=A0ABT0VGG4_9LACO|nr:cysteine--tRNA ligase [Periweissella beninensis]MBM7544608.1 cysteinyl-tRNA synthetase [Periweissella beninensis]MCM2436875.1 cysteine--tRNA ligase [Periweissella beninensis]